MDFKIVFRDTIGRFYLVNFESHQIYILFLHIPKKFNLQIVFINLTYIPIHFV